MRLFYFISILSLFLLIPVDTATSPVAINPLYIFIFIWVAFLGPMHIAAFGSRRDIRSEEKRTLEMQD